MSQKARVRILGKAAKSVEREIHRRWWGGKGREVGEGRERKGRREGREGREGKEGWRRMTFLLLLRPIICLMLPLFI